jgi:putative phage-type endonuclease
VSAKQGTEAWLKERKHKVTGSQVGAILNLSPFSDREKLMNDWLTDKKFEGNVATQWGIDNEDLAKANYEKLMHTTVEDAYFVTHPKHEWLGASPDGYVGELTLVEIKCPYGKRNDPVPEFKSIHDQPHYYAQIQIQLYCTGRTHCHFFQWTPNLCEMEIVEFNQKWIDENLPKLREFYDEFLVRSDLVGDDLDLCNEYHELKQDFDEAKEKLDAHKKLMIAKADGKKRIFGDVQCYPSESKGSINYRKALEDNAPDLDLEPYRGKSSTTWTVK